jgi:aryl-alcohol dehydrogenase-like predicted oxidoreductase
MQKRRLGRTGLLVSPIAVGGAPFGYEQKSVRWNPVSDEGRATVQDTLNRALDLGINYFDTAPAYGNGHSETLMGCVVRQRRQECVLASKVWYELDYAGVVKSVEASLKRLQTDYIDVMQVHGLMYSASDVEHVLNGGPLAALVHLRAEGKIGHIGLTAEEPWSALPFLAYPEFEVFQIAYNIIRQGAAVHFLLRAAEADVGVVSMRTMTSGLFQRELRYLAPGLDAEHNLYDLSLKFILSDSRIHSGIIGMRWSAEVERNVQVAGSWIPPKDFAGMPRTTLQLYMTEDEEASITRT